MIEFVPPQPLFNPFLAPPEPPPPDAAAALAMLPDAAAQLMAGPGGLLLFVPLAPLTRWLGRRMGRRALLLVPLAWWLLTVLATLGGLILWSGMGIAVGWIALLAAARRRRWLGETAMIIGVWVGLHLLILPLWWFPHWWWYPGKLAPLHALGAAYFLMRLIAWGVRSARHPEDPARPYDTLLWLLYPPCARLGPVMLREEFFEELDAWNPAAPTPWWAIGQRVAYLVLGCIVMGVCVHNFPHARAPNINFFDTPEVYSTPALLSLLVLIPTIGYLALWIYNELAAAMALWVGLPVRNNFDWLPLATNVRGFWRSWHVTVGDWLDRHIFKPLGGHRRRTPLNYFLVFGYSALWHGASLSFLVWGMATALAINIQRVWDLWRKRTGRRDWPSHPAWRGASWALTMMVALTTMVVFVDFEHAGARYFRELARRLLSGDMGPA